MRTVSVGGCGVGCEGRRVRGLREQGSPSQSWRYQRKGKVGREDACGKAESWIQGSSSDERSGLRVGGYVELKVTGITELPGDGAHPEQRQSRG